MKVFKIILGVIGAIVALFLIIPLFLPSSATLTRTIEINKPPEVVFMQVADFNNYIKWNPWTEMEPTAKNTISGPVADVGATWSWEGEQVGMGSLTIKEIKPNKAITSHLVFLAPWEGEATDNWSFEPTDNGTKVTWIYAGEFSYFMRYMGMGLEGMLGPQYEQGLSNLKELAESLPEPMEEEMMEGESTEDSKS